MILKILPFRFALIFLPLLVSCGGGGGDSTSTPSNPSVAARTSVIDVGDIDCIYGGILVESGIDENANGILDTSEVDTSEKVCHGEPGLNSLISTEVVGPSSTCSFGGLLINYGLDSNRNDILDTPEITSSNLLCHGGEAGNNIPVADAGSNQTVAMGDTVNLDAIASSDADGDTLTYIWNLAIAPDGSTAVLSSETTQTTSFVANVPGTYTISLMVNDGTADSVITGVVITSIGNQAPIADAGPDQTVNLASTVTLDASASDDNDGDPITYLWSLTTLPVGSGATLTNSTSSNPTFVADELGIFVATLFVNDGMVDSVESTVTITSEVLSYHLKSGSFTNGGGIMSSGSLTLKGFISQGNIAEPSSSETYLILNSGFLRN